MKVLMKDNLRQLYLDLQKQSFENVKTMWTGRLTLIWGITSNGHLMCTSIDWTTKTKDFGIFMYIFIAYLNNW